jgi:DtxR family Mn-dependent transcriptional regulator
MKSESRSEQDYLKTIFEEIERCGEATTSNMAARLSVAPASVTGMFKKLAKQEPPLILYTRHRGAVLTPEGRKVALEMIRHHRLIELFLMKVLGFGWDEVHEEADRLEHVLSDAMEERIAVLLGNPTLDPHGAQIPDESLAMELLPIVRLGSLKIGQKAVIRSVPDNDPELLRNLARQSLTPREEITVVDRSPVERSLTLRIASGKKKAVLGQAAAGKIYVEIIP